VAYSGSPLAYTKGSIFSIQWGSGSGSSNSAADAAIQLNRSSSIEHCGFLYPSQVLTASSPTEYGASILAYDISSNTNQSAIDDWCANCYNLIDFRGSQAGQPVMQATVIENHGSPINIAVIADWWADWGLLNDNNFNSTLMWPSDSAPSSHIRGWTAANGLVFHLGYGDWYNLIGNQAFGYADGLAVDFATACCGAYTDDGPVTLTADQFDAMEFDVVWTGTMQDLKIENSNFTAYNVYTGTGGVVLSTSGTTDTIHLQFVGDYVFGPTKQLMDLNSTIGQVIAANNITEVTSSGQTAFDFTTGDNVLLTGNILGGYSTVIPANTITNLVNTNNPF
jgi:hypothetical protein